jgi:hypothetical protein
VKIKDWKKFQHFKDRRPPWIKLYRDLLDDDEWFLLPPVSAKTLVLLWLLASEDETKQGLLPPFKKIAFRLRMSEKSLQSIVSDLSHWLIQDDINTASPCHQLGPSETEAYTKEIETYNTETELCALSDFETFWKAYPKKIGKKAAEQAWRKAKDKPNVVDTLQAIENAKHSDQWTKENGQFIPNPSTWINQGRWADEPIKKQASTLEAFLNRKDHDEPLRIR